MIKSLAPSKLPDFIAKKEPKRGVFYPWAFNTDLLYSTIDLKIEELLLESKIRICDGMF